ncbi:hypothetical protein MPSEU_000974600 [Mayamaea pseudoterrestris]|nr:hypothetical protein MPSEU_000974600 [Mayamaea pseudoterrestris]
MSSPLLLLFDGYLSQDQERVEQALQVITGDDATISSSHAASPPFDLLTVLQTFLLANSHVAAIPSSHDGSLPLHFAASFGNVAVAELIWKHYPQAASTPNVKGKIPLHYAAREGRTDMVLWFLKADPRTASLSSSKNKLALHFASGDGHVEIVQALLKVYPEGARMVSAKGKLPLHFAARWGHVAIARELMQVHPRSVRALDWDGSLPLHDCAREGQYEMARFLVEQYPRGLLTANLQSEIPLFPAVRSANMDLLCYIMQAYPAGAQHVLRSATPQDWEWGSQEIMELLLRGAVGNFANCALLRGRVVPAIHFLDDENVMDTADLGSSSEGSNSRDSPSMSLPRSTKVISPSQLPSFDLPAPSVNTCAKANSSPNTDDNLKKRKSSTLDPSGRKRSKHKWRLVVHHSRPFLPLHAALQSGASYQVVQHVYDTYGGAQRQDELGRLPLHIALTRCTSDEDPRLFDFVNNFLVSQESASVGEGQTNRLALHIALDSNAHVSVVERLLDVYPRAGVEPCSTNDVWNDELPIYRAAHCDLSVVYRMLRVDPMVLSMESTSERRSAHTM